MRADFLLAATFLASPLLGSSAMADTITEAEPNNIIAQANPLMGLGDLQADGSTSIVADGIHPTSVDYDYYRFFVNSPGNVTFTLTNADSGFADKLSIYDHSGAALFPGFPLFQSTNLDLGHGVYYVAVAGAVVDPPGPVYSLHEDYTLDVRGLANGGIGAATVSGQPAAVPEPGAWALIALGTLPLLRYAARRRVR